jgi:hypothetical protein
MEESRSRTTARLTLQHINLPRDACNILEEPLSEREILEAIVQFEEGLISGSEDVDISITKPTSQAPGMTTYEISTGMSWDVLSSTVEEVLRPLSIGGSLEKIG